MRSVLDFDIRKFAVRLYEHAFEADIFNRAAQVAFYFTFSLFPLLLVLISLFGLILDSTESLMNELFAYLNRVMPSAAFELVKATLTEIANTSTGEKLTIGFIVLLWSASAGVDSIRSSLNTVYKLRETRNWGLMKLESIGLTLVFVVLIGLVMVLFFYGWNLANIAFAYLGFSSVSPMILVSVQWFAVILVLLFACEIIFNLLPNFAKRRWIWITPGSVVAILLWMVLTGGFRLYLSYFDSYSRTYGSLGAVIILLLWLYLTSIALLVGGVINASLGDPQSEATDLLIHPNETKE